MSNKNIEELLPFYINGSLSEAERAEVEQGLKENDDLAKEAELLSKLREQVKAQPQVQSPGELGLKRLEKTIKQEKIKGNSFGQFSSKLIARQNNNPWRVVALAACLLLVLQTAINIQKYQSEDLTAASGATSISETADISVTFSPEATEAEIRQLLVDLHLHIVGGPSALGVYYIYVEGDVDKVTQVLRAQSKLIDSVQKVNR